MSFFWALYYIVDIPILYFFVKWAYTKTPRMGLCIFRPLNLFARDASCTQERRLSTWGSHPICIVYIKKTPKGLYFVLKRKKVMLQYDKTVPSIKCPHFSNPMFCFVVLAWCVFSWELDSATYDRTAFFNNNIVADNFCIVDEWHKANNTITFCFVNMVWVGFTSPCHKQLTSTRTARFCTGFTETDASNCRHEFSF